MNAWYDDRAKLLLLLEWLGDMSPSGFRDVVRSPWDYEQEYQTAAAAKDHQAVTGHEVWHDGQSDAAAYCNVEDCTWRVEDGDFVPLIGAVS